MDTDQSKGMSKRGWSNVVGIMPQITAAVEERKRLHQNPSFDSNIDLSTAENWLIRPELIEICKDAIANKLDRKHFSYPSGFGGDLDVLDAFARFFNDYFHPNVPVESSHVVTAPGAASCIDAILYNICDPGDGILIPAPYWSAFDFVFRSRSSVNPIPVNIPDIHVTLTEALIPALEDALEKATCPIKGILLTNPQNPLGQCYPRSILEGCLKLCQRHKIHFISDEIYALTSYTCPDLPSPAPFISALSLDLASLGCDLSRLHTVWSTSKDFGQSGVRMGCAVTQENKGLAAGIVLATNTQTSSLSGIFVAALLTSPKLPAIIALNSERLGHNYKLLTDFLTRHQITYIPSNAGLYVFARMARDAQTWEDEQAAVQKLKSVGVLVSAGQGYHVPEANMGWMRVGFAVERPRLEEALRRAETIYGSADEGKVAIDVKARETVASETLPGEVVD